MGYYTEKGYRERQLKDGMAKHKADTAGDSPGSVSEKAIEAMAKATTLLAQESAISGKNTTQAIEEMMGFNAQSNKDQGEALAQALTQVITDVLAQATTATPVRLVVNRKNQLISSIDVLPLKVKKTH